MPIYEYRCIGCALVVEAIVKSADAHPTEGCPNYNCPGYNHPDALRREGMGLGRGPALQFKGGGWAADGYASVSSKE